MEEKNKKDNNSALIGTILFHLVLIVCFMFFGLSTPLPLPEEEGVLVDIGYVDEGMGEREPVSSPQTPASPEPSQPEATEEEDVVTQSTEETISMPDTESPSPDDEPETELQEEVEETIEHEEEVLEDEIEEEPEPTPDPQAMFPGSDERDSEDESEGESEETGDEGRPEGSIEGEGAEGEGAGSGVEYSLSGRSSTSLPMPEYTSPETGRVVVSITVNRQGEIIRASAGARGTTTSNQTLWKVAEEAAKNAKFNVKEDAPEQQTGTITYNFIRVN